MTDSFWRPRPQPLGRYFGLPLGAATIGSGALVGGLAHDLGLLDEMVNFAWRPFILTLYAIGFLAAPVILIRSAVRR